MIFLHKDFLSSTCNSLPLMSVTRSRTEPLCHFYLNKRGSVNAPSLLPLSGLFLILGLMLYPAGWGSNKVQLYCGPDAAPYRAGLCSMGWAFYTAMGGTVLTFVCAVFSAQAEIATSSDKVQEEIEEGKSLICLLWGSHFCRRRRETGQSESAAASPDEAGLCALFTTRTDSKCLFCVSVGEIYKCQVFFSVCVFVFLPLEVLCVCCWCRTPGDASSPRPPRVHL